MRARGRGPKGIRVAVESRFGRAVRWYTALHDSALAVALSDGRAEFFQALHVRIGQQSATVRRDAKHQLATAADCSYVAINSATDLSVPSSFGCQNQCFLCKGVSASTGRQRR